MRIEAEDVDGYLAALPPDRRAALSRIRALIKETLPEVQESMRYGMPTFEMREVICSLASQKNYISLYLDTARVAAHGPALAHLKPGKSCVRFKRLDQLPLDTVRQILTETAAAQAAADS